MKKKLPNKYKLNGGFFYNDDSLKVLKSKGFVKKYQNKIDLVLKKEILIISNSNLDITKNVLEIVNEKIKKID